MWAGRQEVPPAWKMEVGVEPGAWRLWAAAVREGARVRLPWQGVGAVVPS